MENRYKIKEVNPSLHQVVVELELGAIYEGGIYRGKSNEFSTKKKENGDYIVGHYFGKVVAINKESVTKVAVGDYVVFNQLAGIRVPGYEQDIAIEVVAEGSLKLKSKKKNIKDMNDTEVLSERLLVKLVKEAEQKTESGLIYETNADNESEFRMTDMAEIVKIADDVPEGRFNVGDFVHFGSGLGEDIKEMGTAKYDYRTIHQGSVVFTTKR